MRTLLCVLGLSLVSCSTKKQVTLPEADDIPKLVANVMATKNIREYRDANAKLANVLLEKQRGLPPETRAGMKAKQALLAKISAYELVQEMEKNPGAYVNGLYQASWFLKDYIQEAELPEDEANKLTERLNRQRILESCRNIGYIVGKDKEEVDAMDMRTCKAMINRLPNKVLSRQAVRRLFVLCVSKRNKD